jgi:hypothetical protein
LETRIGIFLTGSGQAIDGKTSTPDAIAASVMQLSLLCQKPFSGNAECFTLLAAQRGLFHNRKKKMQQQQQHQKRQKQNQNTQPDLMAIRAWNL